VADQTSWAEHLDDALAALHDEPDGLVVVQIGDGPYYAQLLRDDGSAPAPRALVEVVSNEYLPSDLALSPQQESALAARGWNRPGTSCDPAESCSLDHPNWFRFADVGATRATRRELAALVMAALGVYGLTEGTPVVVTG